MSLLDPEYMIPAVDVVAGSLRLPVALMSPAAARASNLKHVKEISIAQHTISTAIFLFMTLLLYPDKKVNELID